MAIMIFSPVSNSSHHPLEWMGQNFDVFPGFQKIERISGPVPFQSNWGQVMYLPRGHLKLLGKDDTNCYKKCPFMSTLRVKNVHAEVVK